MTRKQERGATTATRLLDAALELHARGGPDRFTVHAVVRESGVSLGSLYHHFGSFDGLSAQLFARCLGRLLDAIIASVTPVGTARAGITALVRAYLAFTKDEPAAAYFIHAQSQTRFFPDHGAVIDEVRGPRLATLFAWLRPHVQARRVVDLSPPMFEVLVIGPVAEVARRWLAKDPAFDLEEATRVLPERVWRSVRRESSAAASG